MKKRFFRIVAIIVITFFILLIAIAAIMLFNAISSYVANEKGTYQMVKINEFDIEEFSDTTVVELINNQSSNPKYQYLRHMKDGRRIGSLPASRTMIHEDLVDYRVEVYQKKPNLWSDAYFEWIRDLELYDFEDVEYKLYVPLKMITRAE
ncbi:hypothetical protein ABD91_21185 [Lysinibacillus sphaericus]|nr:hypothetical protein [Lysinibacillus sphaericus]